jgi:diaminopimelate epimerase
MRLSFVKMHGLGNDFIVFDVASDAQIPNADTFRKLGHRRTGIGFDQALVLMPPRASGTDVYYRIFNCDGSEVEQCGNGARCIASLVAQRLGGRAELHMDSTGGRVDALLKNDGTVSVDFGVPNFSPASLPFDAANEASLYPLEVSGRTIEIGAVSMGNPHAVWRVPSVEQAPVDSLGPLIENHPRFPKRVNAGFAEVVSRDHLRLRVWERGVGETLACGTGTCAAVAVGIKLGWLQAGTVQVDLPGGRASVTWQSPGSRIWLTGPAVKVFEGQVDI